MQRLIDADWFRRYVHEQLELGKTYTDDEILEMIDEQPTAYDVEAVVAELEKILGDTNFEKATQEVNESFYDGLAYAYGMAISIVRGKE